MSLLMTTRGIPQIYYGSEIGMTGSKDKSDGDIRRDFPGGWKGDSINAFTANGRTAIQNEYFNFMAKLLNWRKTKPVIHNGQLTQYVPEKDTYVYFRYNDMETIMVVINNNETEQTLRTDRFAESLKDLTSGVDVITGKTYDMKSDLTIAKQTALILEVH